MMINDQLILSLISGIPKGVGRTGTECPVKNGSQGSSPADSCYAGMQARSRFSRSSLFKERWESGS